MAINPLIYLGANPVYTDVAGTVPATTNGALIANAGDSSGVAILHPGTQATVANQPLLAVPATGFNSQNALAFDGTARFLTTGYTIANTNITATFVAKWAANGFILTDNIAASYNTLAIGRDSTGKLFVYHGNGTSYVAINSNTVLALGTTYIITVSISSGGSVRIYINGNLDATGSSSYTSNWAVTFASSTYQVMNGNIATARIFSGALSDADRTTVETPLATTYGITYAAVPPANTPPDGTERIHYSGIPNATFANNSGVSGGGTSRTFISGVPLERMQQNGVIRQAKMYVNGVGVANGWKIKVYRPNGANYDLVGESETFQPIGTGLQTYNLTSPITVEEGDIPGIWITGGGGLALRTTASTTNSYYYTTGDITGTNQVINTADVNLSLDLELLGASPLYGFSGDSIIAGHNQGAGNYWAPFLDGSSYNPIGGTHLSSVPYRLQKSGRLANYTYLNAAKGGQTFSWVNTVGMPALVAAKVTNIFIHCGINDAAQSRSWATVQSDLDGIKAQKLSFQKLYIDEVLPDSSGSGTDTEAGFVRSYNTNLATWCAANGAYLIPMHDSFAQTRVSTGFLDDIKPALTSDNLHLSDAGATQLTNTYINFLAGTVVIPTLSPGSVTIGTVTQTGASLTATDASGGSGPYTYQWYLSSNGTGFYPNDTTAVSGATTLTFSPTGLIPGRRYGLQVSYTDTGGNKTFSRQVAFSTGSANPDYSTGTSPTVDTTGALRVNVVAGGTGGGSTTETYNTTAPTLTNGQTSPLQADVNGNLKVTVAGGAAAGGTSSQFTQTLPATGTAVGFVDQNGKMQVASVAAFHAGDNTTVANGGLGLLTGGVTQIKNAQGNLDRQTEAGLDNIPALGITTGVASYSVPFIFTVAGTITVSAVAQVVTPSSMTNIFVGTVILFDTANATLTEPVVVTVATATTFSGVFTKSHGASASAKAFYYNQARDGAIGDKVTVGGLAAGMTYFVNSVTGLAEQERSAAGELDGATGNGTAIAAEYEFNGSGPALSTGFSSGLSFDRARSLQAKGLAVAVQSAGGVLNTNQITASSAAAVNSLQAGQQIRIDRNTATDETAYVSQTYVPGTAVINLQSNLAFNHTGAAIEWDVFASAGPGLSGFIATGIGIEEEALYNPVDGKYYIERASTTDAMPSANIVAESGVVWNGATFDRERAAYQDALSTTGIPAEAEMLWNGATFDRAREASSDALPITGIAAEAEMLWNGSTFDRARSVQATDGQGPTGFGADAIMLWNGATYDRLRGVNGALTVTLANSGTFTDRSGSITTGGTSQTLAPINATRRYLTIENTSTANIAINFTSAASLTVGSLVIAALGSLTLSSQSFVSTELVTVVGATTGQTFVAKEA